MLLFCVLAAACPDDVRAERTCDGGWHARLLSVEGAVEIATPDGWFAAHSGQTLCSGETVHTGRYGRASVLIATGTVTQVAPDSALHITATVSATDSWYDIVVSVLDGLIHAISRDPRSLSIETPFVNAGIEGTEFVVRVDQDGTTVKVIEGEIALKNAAGSASVTSRTSGHASRTAGPQTVEDPDVLDAIDWTLRFPPIIDGDLPAPDAEPTEKEGRSAEFYVRRAASRLAVGAVPDADADLAQALSLEPNYGDALALNALIALAAGDRAGAVDLAEQAVAAAPDRPAPWLAASHASRAASDRSAALESAEMATRVAPEHAYAWARVGELRFAREDYRGAREAAERAVRLDPQLAMGHVVVGFADLGGGRAAVAEASFRNAVGIDPSNPYARLGLALALYRQGQREAGREEMELAVALDPKNATIRSYAGKIYAEEQRGELAGTLLDIAKALDAADSSGWFYDALRKQHENRPGEALLDYRRSLEAAGRHGVYAGSLALDEDLHARSAGIGRLYSSLGFERLGLATAWRAMQEDPADYSGHRLAADLYARRPRHQLARVNEVHQAIFRQPLNVTPYQAQLNEASPFLFDVAGPSSLEFREYNSLVREDGISYQLSGVTAANDTHGLDFALSGLHDIVSYNIAFFDFETDGIRPNNDFSERVFNVTTQIRPTASTTFSVELRSSDIEKGDVAMRFDPQAYSLGLRETEVVDSLLLGIRHRTANGTWFGTTIAESADADASGVGPYSASSSRRGTSFDLQNVSDRGNWSLTWGVRHLDQNQLDELSGEPLPGDPMIVPGGSTVGTRHDVTHNSAYVYGQVKVRDSLRATIGGNIEEVDTHSSARRRFNPKLGLMWDVSPDTTIRAAAFGTLQAPFVSKHNVMPTLEPTHIVGFNQQYFGAQGEKAWRYGVGIDHEFAENLFAGIELSRRDVEMPYFAVVATDEMSFAPAERTVIRDERSHLFYVNWLPTTALSVAAGYEYDDFDAGDAKLPEGFSKLETHQIPVELNYFHPSGLTAGIEARFVSQSGYFSPVADDALLPEYGEDEFWSVDLSVGYRLPFRRGQVWLKVLNATDEEFRFQDIDPENPRLFPDRMLQMAFTLSY